MAPRLDNFADEIVANITQRLDVHDICSLRRSSRSLAAKCTVARFKSLFVLKRVDLTEQALKKFVEMMQPGSLGCLIQDLTLVGFSKGPKGSTFKEEDIPKEEKIELLAEAFSGLRTNTVAGRLSSLCLEVAITSKTGERSLPGERFVAWKRAWQAARDTFGIAWHALAASKLPIQKLNVFNSRQMQRCSLPSDCLGEVDWETPGLVTSLTSLQSLSVSLCPRDIDVFETTDDGEGPYTDPGPLADDESLKSRDNDDVQAEADDEVNFSGLANFLRLCSQLDYLEIHYFHESTWGGGGIDQRFERLIQRVAEIDRLPTIRHCHLRGVFARGQDLVTLVQRSRVSNLSMENVFSETFRPIFDHCQSSTSAVTAVFFDDLWEARQLLYFNAPGRQKFPRRPHVQGCPTLQRTGDEVKRPISYFVPGGRGLGSPATSQWMQDRHREYGR